jgi:hypothetical protein
VLKEVKDRLELDHRLRENGVDAKLFSGDEARDKAKWVLKQMRLGNLRKKMRPAELR